MKKKDEEKIQRIIDSLDEFELTQIKYLMKRFEKGKTIKASLLTRKFRVTEDQAIAIMDIFQLIIAPMLGKQITEDEYNEELKRGAKSITIKV